MNKSWADRERDFEDGDFGERVEIFNVGGFSLRGVFIIVTSPSNSVSVSVSGSVTSAALSPSVAAGVDISVISVALESVLE